MVLYVTIIAYKLQHLSHVLLPQKNWRILWIRFWNLKGILFLFSFFEKKIWKGIWLKKILYESEYMLWNWQEYLFYPWPTPTERTEYMLWNWHEDLFYPWPTPLNPTVVSIFLKIINDILVNGPLIHLLWCRWTQQQPCIYTITRDSLVVINAKTWESHDLDTSRKFLF